jgi:hypothetical protein
VFLLPTPAESLELKADRRRLSAKLLKDLRGENMALLAHPRILKGDAVNALLQLYEEDPDFAVQRKSIRHPYEKLIMRFTRDVASYWLSSEAKPGEQFQAFLLYYSGKGPDPLPKQMKYLSRLQPYFDELDALTVRWKLQAPWAVISLFILDIMYLLVECPPGEVEPTLEAFSDMYPWPEPLPPLEIKIPSWSMVVMGREWVQKVVTQRLETYEKELTKQGLNRYPYRLSEHARFWFEHHVKGKKYSTLENKYPEANQESIKRAVWKFGKIVDIKTK